MSRLHKPQQALLSHTWERCRLVVAKNAPCKQQVGQELLRLQHGPRHRVAERQMACDRRAQCTASTVRVAASDTLRLRSQVSELSYGRLVRKRSRFNQASAGNLQLVERRSVVQQVAGQVAAAVAAL
eukprot:scaffold1405_cov305-Prasinococcus_capsulatus_cf.AAC.4